MLILKILAFVFLIPGLLMVFGARWAVEKYKLDTNATCDFENEMSEEELRKYKFDKTMVNFKMLGMLVLLPGLILIIVAFK